MIDREVARLVAEGQDRATALLTSHREHLDQLAELLLEAETIDGRAVYDLVGDSVPNRARLDDVNAGHPVDTDSAVAVPVATEEVPA